MPPLFRFNLLLELSRPSNHIDTSTIDEEGDTVYLTPCNRTPPDSNNHNAAKISVRQHPRYSLRIATLIALSLGIVLNTVMLNSYGRQDDTVQILTGTAEWVVSHPLIALSSALLPILSHGLRSPPRNIFRLDIRVSSLLVAHISTNKILPHHS